MCTAWKAGRAPCAYLRNWCRLMESNHITSVPDLQSSVRPSALSVGKTMLQIADLMMRDIEQTFAALQLASFHLHRCVIVIFARLGLA